MFLPTSIGAGQAWALYDYRQVYLTSAPASAGGVATVELAQVPQDELWLIERMVVQSTSVAKSQARIYLDTVDPFRILDGTRAGNFDVADEASPIQIPGGSILVCQWTLATAAAVCTLRAQIVILRREEI